MARSVLYREASAIYFSQHNTVNEQVHKMDRSKTGHYPIVYRLRQLRNMWRNYRIAGYCKNQWLHFIAFNLVIVHFVGYSDVNI